ncbi:hypothetical protein PROAA_1350020 [Candidatus Propionivibrio aalborgensis]|uniref:Uncharacterized protein n=1 Tax=Candidatus Propionivibrio aalborgensis TaxID=1860101 RepID=A0A1A8XLF9_9RHOO|nr:hypothetical protein [Candidatus Propionivibrio aalborgensis]SBT04783.1 hypothetical protein PROAA_1350020 [Candidatus Propionivibrio aalborgensis]
MKIEIFNEALGRPAAFHENCCITKILEAHDPLVMLEDRLSTSIRNFLTHMRFANDFEIEFVEQIDSNRGICLLVNLHIPDSGLIAKFSECTLKARFVAFLCETERHGKVTSQEHANGIAENVDSEHGDIGNDCSSRQLGFSAASFSRSEDFQHVLPHGLVDGECYKFDRFERSVGVMISSRRTLSISIGNAQWLDALANAARV